MQRIFVGDVQGCAEEFEDVISKANAAFGDEFSLWITGDLVNRGPDSRRALELVRGLVEAGRAEYVLGNHEIFAISVGLGLRDLRPGDSLGDMLGAPDAAEWIDWLRRRPLVVSGEIGGQRFVMVHAATDPDWSLDQLVEKAADITQRLSASRQSACDFLSLELEAGTPRDHLGRLTRCRSVTPEGDWSSREPATPERAWHRVWASRSHDYGIVYGHWARQGLHVAQGLRGLDTGCVHHGRGRDGFLTAWLPESGPRREAARPFDAPDDRFWQIPARRRYLSLG